MQSSSHLITKRAKNPKMARPKTEERRPFDRNVVANVESWLEMLDTSDDADQFLDRLLLDGTAREMRDQEIEVARAKKVREQDEPLEETLRVLDLLLQEPVPVDRTATGSKHPSNPADRTAKRRPNLFLDRAVQDTLASYEIRTRRTPLQLSEPISPTSQGA